MTPSVSSSVAIRLAALLGYSGLYRTQLVSADGDIAQATQMISGRRIGRHRGQQPRQHRAEGRSLFGVQHSKHVVHDVRSFSQHRTGSATPSSREPHEANAGIRSGSAIDEPVTDETIYELDGGRMRDPQQGGELSDRQLRLLIEQDESRRSGGAEASRISDSGSHLVVDFEDQGPEQVLGQITSRSLHDLILYM